jgi:CTD nuclear envelope phosphatase 1
MKRPHADDFLENVCKWFNVVIFTASSESYANLVLDLFKNTNFEAKLFRNHCDDTYFEGKRVLMKDLDKLGRKISKGNFLEV